MGELQQQLIEELHLEKVDHVLLDNPFMEGISFSDLFEQVMELDSLSMKLDLGKKFLYAVFEELIEGKTLCLQIILFTITFAFLNHFINLFKNSQISKTGFYLYVMILMVLLMKSYLLMDDLLIQVMEQTIDLMQAVIPVFCMTMTFASAGATAMVFYQIAVVVIWLVERILCYVMTPGVHIYVVLQMLNCITGEKVISRFTRLLRSVMQWSLRAMLAGVTGMNMIENILAPSVDNLKKMSITKTLSMIPGLGDTTEAVTNIFLGSTAVIKNGVGTTVMVILVCFALGPAVKMAVFVIFYKLTGALVQPFADQRVSGCIDSVGEGAGFLLRILITGIMMFLITIAIVVTASK